MASGINSGSSDLEVLPSNIVFVTHAEVHMSCHFFKIRIKLLICSFIVHVVSGAASDIHGTVQLHPKSDFDVVTTRLDTSYDIANSNTNDFFIKAAVYMGGDSAVAVATDGTERDVSLDYRLAGPGAVLDARQLIHVELQSPEDITWYPDAIERPGYTTYRYHGHLSPKSISFSPPVVFSFYDGDTLVGTSGEVPIRELRFNGKPLMSLHLSSVELNAQRVKLEIQGGFTREDKFLIASDATPLNKPGIGAGTEVAFIADSDPSIGVPLEMYYPTGGPHVITFPKGFDCNDLRVDGTRILTNSAHVNTGIFRIPMKWYRIFGTSYDDTTVTFEVTFDDPTAYVYDLHVAGGTRFLDLLDDRLSKLATDEESKRALTELVSDRITRLSFPLSEFAEQPAWYPLTSEEFVSLTSRSDQRDVLLNRLTAKPQPVASIELPIVSGASPLVVTGKLSLPDGTPLGSYDGDLVVSGANLERVRFPVRYELYDPIGPTKQTFGGVTIALLTSYLGWALFDRRRKQKDSASAAALARYETIQDHYADLLDLQRRVNAKSKSGQLQWKDVDADLRWMLRKKLQNMLSPESWNGLQRAIVTQNAEAVYEVFGEEINLLQADGNANSRAVEAIARSDE